MSKVNSLALALILFGKTIFAQENSVIYKVNLGNEKDDKINVELLAPKINVASIQFHFPKMVPGTYSVYDFGRFISNLEASDINGKQLSVNRKDINSWTIENASQLHKIVYTVDDTWDTDSSNFVFEPAGTGFFANQCYMFNNHGVFGFFENMENIPVQLQITHAPKLYAATAAINTSKQPTVDVFDYENYHRLVDSPIMYAVPDTASFYVGNTKVQVALVDEGNKVKASFLAEQIKPVLQAAGNYFGGKLPVENYCFLVYLHKGESKSGSDGALEHSYSSVYSLPSIQGKELAQSFKNVAAHEFYHVITPLNIHSKEIGEFNYINPKMSKHLWLYEGVTEYFAHYVQLRSGLISKKQYVDEMNQKVILSTKYYNDTLPFTVMSKNCLDTYKKEYGNVYQKGALIALGLDLLLLKKSNGKYGIQDLINDLSLKYGKNNSFNDDELFTEITKMTYPEVGEYFDKYVQGNNPLPLEQLFADIGVDFKRVVIQQGYSYGKFSLGYDYPKSKALFISAIDNTNEINKAFGYQKGDVLYKLNKNKISILNYGDIKSDWEKTVKEGDEIKMTVLRKDEKGKSRKVTLTSVAKLTELKRTNVIEGEKTLDASQQFIYNKWLGVNN